MSMTRAKRLNAWQRVGALMFLLGMAGPLLTVRAVQREVDSVDTSGTSDPGMVSKPIGHVLIPSFVGLAIAIPGCALMISCLVLQLKERKKSGA